MCSCYMWSIIIKVTLNHCHAYLAYGSNCSLEMQGLTAVRRCMNIAVFVSSLRAAIINKLCGILLIVQGLEFLADYVSECHKQLLVCDSGSIVFLTCLTPLFLYYFHIFCTLHNSLIFHANLRELNLNLSR